MDVPMDITIEILSRLPVKSLMRFKCVSISFYNLISNDPFFRKKHLHHQSSLKKVILVPPLSYGSIFGSNTVSSLVALSPKLGYVREDMIGLKLPFEKVGQVTYHNSCDGLLCMSTSYGDVVIWNPSTRQVSKFQGCELHRPGIYIVYSLAHDPRSNVYKLLGVAMYGRHFTYNGQNKYNAYFYSTETGMWRYIKDSSRTHTCKYVEYCGKTTVVNGAFHWLGGNERHRTPYVVVTLDISDETYGTLALPQAICDVLRAPVLREMKGKLCIMGHHTKNPSWDIWVMNEYGDVGSMVRMFSMSFGELSNTLSWPPIHMLEDDTLVIYGSGNIYSYKDGRFLRITLNRENNMGLSPNVYFESLISPHTFVPNGFSATMGCVNQHVNVVTKNQWPRWCLKRLCCGKSF